MLGAGHTAEGPSQLPGAQRQQIAKAESKCVGGGACTWASASHPDAPGQNARLLPVMPEAPKGCLPARPFSGEELQRAEMQTKDPAGNGILLGHKKIRS